MTIEVDWYLNHAGKPLVTLSTGSGRSTTLDVDAAGALVLDLLKVIAESQAPNAEAHGAEAVDLAEDHEADLESDARAEAES
jgi:hypothetical protein